MFDLVALPKRPHSEKAPKMTVFPSSVQLVIGVERVIIIAHGRP
ncbi:MAG: hypothetical protein WD669_12115 [Pirellulales bacterium]